jgi:Tfp pilus assembly PilM family ATPase
MRLNIFEQHKPIFGIHLNGTALKFVQLQKQSGGISFVGYSNVPLPKNLIANDTILDAAALAKLIQQNLIKPQFGRITTNRVVVSVPESKSFIRVIHIPEMSESQAENAVMFEAEAYIPLLLD